MQAHASSCKLMQTCMPIKISFGEVGASSSATAWGGVGGVFGICEATGSGIEITGFGVPEQLAGLAAGTGGGGGGACHLAPGGGGLGRF